MKTRPDFGKGIRICCMALAMSWPISSLHASSVSTAVAVTVQVAPVCKWPTVFHQRLSRLPEFDWRKPDCCPPGVDYFYQIGTKGPLRRVSWDSAGRPIVSLPMAEDSKLPLDVVTLTIYF